MSLIGSVDYVPPEKPLTGPETVDVWKERMDERMRALSAAMEADMWGSVAEREAWERRPWWKRAWWQVVHWGWYEWRHRLARLLDPWPCGCGDE